MMLRPITLAGEEALECLQHGKGDVLARFPSSVYLRCETGAIACLLPQDSEPGPLHALLQGRWPDPVLLPEPGTRWWPNEQGLVIGRIVCDLSSTRRWTVPSPAPFTGTGAGFEGSAPEETFLAVLLGDVQRLGHADWRQPALAVVARLMRWMDGRGRLPDLGRLVGLGPGLTPAADDFLGALVLTLRARGESEMRLALIEAVAPLLGRTHPISAAHLRNALEGRACEALHRVIHAIAAGHMPDADTLGRLTRVGAQSGWDMLAGVLVGARLLGPPDGEEHMEGTLHG